MAFDKCPKCGFMHYRIDPCPVRKSIAARKGVQGDINHIVRSASGVEDRVPVEAVVAEERGSARFESEELVGTQAPPIGAKIGRPKQVGPSLGKSKRAQYIRDYMRRKRAQMKP